MKLIVLDVEYIHLFLFTPLSYTKLWRILCIYYKEIAVLEFNNYKLRKLLITLKDC